MGGTERCMPLERDLVVGFDNLQTATAECLVRRPLDLGLSRGSWLRIAHEVEQTVGGREWRACRFFPIHLQLFRSLNRVLFALANDRDIIAFAHDLDESGNIPHG